MSQWDPNYGTPQHTEQGYPSSYYNSGQENQPQFCTVQDLEAQYSYNNNAQGSNVDYKNNHHTKNTRIDVRNSNLQATASEFRPGSSYNQGAVKRKSVKSRVFSSKSDSFNTSKYDGPEKYNRKYDYREDSDKISSDAGKIPEQDKTTKETRYDYWQDDESVKETGRYEPRYDQVRPIKETGRFDYRHDQEKSVKESGRYDVRQDQEKHVKESGRYDYRQNYKENRGYDRQEQYRPQKESGRYDYRQERNNTVKETTDFLNRVKLNSSEPILDNNRKYKGNNGSVRGGYNKKNPRWPNDRRNDNWRHNRNERFVEEDKNSLKVDKYSERPNDEWSRLSKPRQLKKKLDAASQRERLEQMVTHRLLECLVCCEKLRHTDKIWSCKQCFHILHLSCVIRWAKASKLESGWRCPACQNICLEVPNEYRCYCDKYKDPSLEPGTLPHSCGNVCSRKGRSCEHSCTLLCHPGPCPDCTVMVARSCGCGATKPTVKCSSDIQITCQNTCGKLLNCNLHTCNKTCHINDCDDCEESVIQECFCGKVGRKVKCTEEVQNVKNYECGDVCQKLLNCGNHTCQMLCHSGECDPCKTHPDTIKTCPCGQSTLSVTRNSCLDPIPCCDKVCEKKLICGQPSHPHKCQSTCHMGDCPVCPLTTLVRCRCGHMDKELACKELKTKADDARCQKKCTKKRLCCKHKCNQLCCIEVEHDCPLPCNHLLICGLHRCELNCHRGRCQPCWRTSFEELYCECGASVIYPPVACGTRPPACSKPCSRQRLCGHEAHHNCHSGPCPPCTIFTTRLCYGQHEQRQTIPCYQDDFSCGRPCNKDMYCKRHKCIQTCHKGRCPNPCKQPCTIIRPNCEHSCSQPCHEPPCINVPCKQTVTVTCQCGLRSSTRLCIDLASEYQKIAMAQLASKMGEIQRGQSIDITDLVKTKKTGGSHKTLECNEECRLVERNRRLAIGLQIRNPDLSSKLTPRYSEYMRGWAKKDPKFCQKVHDKLTELVQLAKQSKQKSRSHSFECMNREKRHLVHEYCEHFGCDSAAYDKEPNRNIVATAFRDKSWLPSVSLIELLQRENGQRKVPGPVLNKTDCTRTIGQSNQSVSLKLESRNSVPRPVTPPGEFVDYFDNPPQ